MQETTLTNNLFKDFSNFNSLYSNKEKKIKFYKLIKPYILEEEKKIAIRCGDKYLTIALWIGRNRVLYANEKTSQEATYFFTNNTINTLQDSSHKNKQTVNSKQHEHFRDAPDINTPTKTDHHTCNKPNTEKRIYASQPSQSNTSQPKKPDHVQAQRTRELKGKHDDPMEDIQSTPSVIVLTATLIDISDNTIYSFNKYSSDERDSRNNKIPNSEIWNDLRQLDQDIIMEDANLEVEPHYVTQQNTTIVGKLAKQLGGMYIEDHPMYKPQSNETEAQNFFSNPPHSFLPNINYVFAQQQEVTHQHPSGLVNQTKWLTVKQVQRPITNLRQMKQSNNCITTERRENTSMHALQDNGQETYDAFIWLRDMDSYGTIEEKLAFLEINARNTRGFVKIEYNKLEKQFILKYRSYAGMITAVKQFNNFFQNSFIKLQPKKYYTINGMRISTSEFKIMNVPTNIHEDTIKDSIRKITHGAPFYIKKSGIKQRKEKENTVFFTVKCPQARSRLKNTWSIEILGRLYKLAPAHYKHQDLEIRKKYRGEFTGFNETHNETKAVEITTPFNPKHAFMQSTDKAIIEFETEADLFNACKRTYFFRNHTVQGSPCGYNWQKKPRFTRIKGKASKARLAQTKTPHFIHHRW